jgi:polysaccharide export outer membrane protein
MRKLKVVLHRLAHLPGSLPLVCCVLALALVGLGCNVVPTYTPPGYEAASAGSTAAPASEGGVAIPPYVAPEGTGAPVPPIAPTGSNEQLDMVRVGERLTIVFSDLPAPGLPNHEVTVSSDGMISLPFNQHVKAAGKSRQQLQQDIRSIYVPSYYKQMSVNVRADERVFTVGGEVRNPSRQVFVGTMTVLKAIASVGGFTDFADKRRVDITRSNGEKLTIDAVKAQENPQQFDVPIYPDDRIHVHRRWI